MTIKNKFPAIKPSLLLDFANSKQVDPRITFARAGTATYWDDKGVLQTAASGVPRIDHDPVTGECKGLLIEEQRTNLALYSGAMSQVSAWVLEGSSSTSTTIAPDGASIAACFDASGPTFALTRQGFASFSGGYTLSVYAKALPSTANRYLFIGLINGSAGFDLVGGSVTWTASGATASVSSVGNGWYRCAVAFTASSTSQQYFYFSSSPTNSLAPAAGPACALWGAQLEAGAFPTSYIPTTVAQVTRAADSASMTGTNFSSWYRQDEGTFVTESFVVTGSSVRGIAGINGNGHIAYINANGSVACFDSTEVLATGTYSPGAKTATAYGGSSIAVSLSGSAPVSGAFSSPHGTGDGLNIGSLSGGTFRLNGHVKRIAYYPKRLANTELQALTA